jgi:hypothetical protein
MWAECLGMKILRLEDVSSLVIRWPDVAARRRHADCHPLGREHLLRDMQLAARLNHPQSTVELFSLSSQRAPIALVPSGPAVGGFF